MDSIDSPRVMRGISVSLPLVALLLLFLAQPAVAEEAEASPSGEGDEAGPADDDELRSPRAGLTPQEQMQRELTRLRRRVVDLQREIAELRGDPREPSVPLRSLDVEFSAAVLAGNVSEVTLRTDVQFALEHPAIYRLSLGADYELRLRESSTVQQNLDGTAEFALLPNDPISPFVLAEAGFDEMRRQTLRLDTGLGVRWTVLRDPAEPVLYQHDPYAYYGLSVGFVLNHEQFQPSANLDHRTFVRLDVRLEAEQRIVPGLFLGNRFRLFIVLEETENLELRNEVYLRLALGEDHFVRALYVFREDTRPAPGVRRVDHQFQLALAARFR